MDLFSCNFLTAAAFGKGVYFAVNAKYSATKYSLADESGLKRLYMARVITGRYTVGSSTMKAPPARGTDPTDCFDSLVNCQVQPVIFVIFHDDQAYPEYLITFSWATPRTRGNVHTLQVVFTVPSLGHSSSQCLWFDLKSHNLGSSSSTSHSLFVSNFLPTSSGWLTIVLEGEKKRQCFDEKFTLCQSQPITFCSYGQMSLWVWCHF